MGLDAGLADRLAAGWLAVVDRHAGLGRSVDSKVMGITAEWCVLTVSTRVRAKDAVARG